MTITVVNRELNTASGLVGLNNKTNGEDGLRFALFIIFIVVGICAALFVFQADKGQTPKPTFGDIPPPKLDFIPTAGLVKYVRLGECQIKESETWKDKWNCVPGENFDIDRTVVPIAIVGDSHASDKSMMLRLYGYSAYQFTAGGCSFAPDVKSFCREYFEFAHDKIRNNPEIKEIWLANYFSFREARPEYLKAALEYWSLTGKKLVVFSQTPVFKDFDSKMQSGRAALTKEDLDLERYYQFSSPENLALFEQNDVLFLDMGLITCDGLDACYMRNQDGQLLQYDKTHLTVAGGIRAGQRLFEQLNCKQGITAWYSVIARPNDCLNKKGLKPKNQLLRR